MALHSLQSALICSVDFSTVLRTNRSTMYSLHPLSLLQLIPVVTMSVNHRPDETSPVPSSTVTTSRSLYAGEFFGAAFPGSSRLPWPSLSLTSSALPCSPSRANLSTLQDSLDVTGCGFALLISGGYNASAPPVTQKHWLPATRLPDHYRDWTSTG